MLTQAQLKKRFAYNPRTGIFIRLWTRAGSVAGTAVQAMPSGQGYLRMCIDGKKYLAHRLAWLYVYGTFPKGRLDHKDNDGSNNRIANLRRATGQQNKWNEKVRKDSKSQLKGVRRVSKNRYRAKITAKKGRTIHLGYFSTAKKAHTAYCAAAQKYFGEFARLI